MDHGDADEAEEFLESREGSDDDDATETIQELWVGVEDHAPQAEVSVGLPKLTHELFRRDEAGSDDSSVYSGLYGHLELGGGLLKWNGEFLDESEGLETPGDGAKLVLHLLEGVSDVLRDGEMVALVAFAALQSLRLLRRLSVQIVDGVPIHAHQRQRRLARPQRRRVPQHHPHLLRLPTATT